MDYAKAERLFATARNKDEGKPLANNTRLFKRGNNFAIQLHSTDVVTIRPDNSCVLDSGGWKTMTTKDRMQTYSPVGRIESKRGTWYVHAGGDTKVFKDGIKIKADGTIVGGAPVGEPKKEQALRKRAKAYAKAFVDALHAGDVGAPSLGDCFMCMAYDRDGKHVMSGADHILNHFDESYFVPSLLVNALKERGASIAETQTAWAFMKNETQHAFSTDRKSFVFTGMEKAIYKHCCRQLGLAT